MLNHIYDMKMWLENGPVKITKMIIQHVIGYLVKDRVKSVQCQEKYVINVSVVFYFLVGYLFLLGFSYTFNNLS